MYVKIGPYINYWGPYQLANIFFKGLLGEKRSEKIGDWLAETWVGDFCEFIYKMRKRKVIVKLDHYDTWNMDHTLSLIILPMLMQLRDQAHGAPDVDDDDVPDNLKKVNSTPSLDDSGLDENYFRRWNCVLDQMIVSFKYLADSENDPIILNSDAEKIYKGLRLFGKYYQSMWT